VVADCQTAGKGRRGRSWESPKGTGIWMSLVMRPKVPPMCASMLTLVAAMAVAKGIDQETGLDSRIKWPNDIVAGSKKVCGILTEMSAELDQIHYVVTGMGINVNMDQFPEEIRETATSLCLETGRKIDRGALIGAIMSAFEEYYKRYEEHQDLSDLMEEYNDKLANRNREVRVLASGGEYTGIALGIDKTGQLLVRREDGSVATVLSGEVSVRGIYGYV
ncbi:MAG: biotin--[acetyl-CoA-carboxylase] ligase, partial [Lachnospiraceae bacterium]